MFGIVSNPLANWLWKDLYVWPEGRLAPSAYLGALFRILIVYVIFAQVLAAIGPVMFGTFNNRAPTDMFESVLWGQVGAIALIAFPLWSNFQRRFNDMRPDLRERLRAWSTSFPLILAGLTGWMIARAAGLDKLLAGVDLGSVRFWFAVMLFGAAFVPGGEAVPASKMRQAAKPAPDLFQTSTYKANREALAAQIAAKPAGRHIPMPHVDQPKHVMAANFPEVIVRTRSLPQDGRVKPGWFS
jgi:hypothetical protein